jgi:hypothetical protein
MPDAVADVSAAMVSWESNCSLVRINAVGRSEQNAMKVAIRMTRRERLKALPIIYRHSPAMVLRDGTYILDPGAVEALRSAGVRFKEITREAEVPGPEEVRSGERV